MRTGAQVLAAVVERIMVSVVNLNGPFDCSHYHTMKTYGLHLPIFLDTTDGSEFFCFTIHGGIPLQMSEARKVGVIYQRELSLRQFYFLHKKRPPLVAQAGRFRSIIQWRLKLKNAMARAIQL
jgi:hypothetical protein